MYIFVCVCVWTYVFMSLGYTPGSKLLGQMGSLYLTLGGTAKLFSKAVAPGCNSCNNA